MKYTPIRGPDLLQRWEGNPAITVKDIPFRANTVFNGTPIVTNDGIYLLLRVEGQHGYSFFALARSKDGFNFTIDDLFDFRYLIEGHGLEMLEIEPETIRGNK